MQPATIGYSLVNSPLGLLAYIGEKLLAWSDPTTVEMDDIITTVAIYYLTQSFHTSVMMYQQTGRTFPPLMSYGAWGKIGSIMGFSAFVSLPGFQVKVA